MNTIRNIFGLKGKSKTTLTEENNNFSLLLEKSESGADLDLNDKRHVPDNNEEPKSSSDSLIAKFLKRDYLYRGRKDGYHYRSSETLEIGKRRIKAEFLLIIDETIEEKNEYRLKLCNMVTEVAQVSSAAQLQLENTIMELESAIDNLQLQKELSIESEGWVMNPIHSYHQGFLYGLNDWIKREDLFKSIRNL